MFGTAFLRGKAEFFRAIASRRESSTLFGSSSKILLRNGLRTIDGTDPNAFVTYNAQLVGQDAG
ncbi:hypothetical protein B7486_07875 [cyanobacterium TDX16]|nr:hypothetical protein B7486_07875 [cyanobacterium TDX16]